MSQIKEKYTFGSPLGSQLEYVEMLNDERMVSLGISRGEWL